MKYKIKVVFIFPLLLLCGLTSMKGQNVSIPDTNFKSALLADTNINLNQDGEIQVSEAIAYTGMIKVNNKSITDMTGIEAFTSCEEINCHGNYNLSGVDLTQNTALKKLRISSCNIGSLDLSQNVLLTELYCSYNRPLANLDLSQNVLLVELDCSHSDSLVSLDLSQNVLLKNAQISWCQISNLNLGLKDSLISLICTNNRLSNLDLSQLPSLHELDCSKNLLTNLNTSQNDTLRELHCGGNQLINLDLSQNTSLTLLYCEGNLITNLIGLQSNLTNIVCDSNQLSSIDFSQCDSLHYLQMNYNLLTTVDVSNCSLLNQIYLEGNNLTSLDLGLNPELDFVVAHNNPNLYCVTLHPSIRPYDDVAPELGAYYLDPQASFSTNCNEFDIDGATREVCGSPGISMTFFPGGVTGNTYEWLLGGNSLGAATLNDSTRFVTTPGNYQVVVNDGVNSDTSHFIQVGICDSLSVILEGTVFKDLDGNGIQDGADHGLGGIKVKMDNGLEINTNQIGYYSFRVDTGTYLITTTAPNFLGCNGNSLVPGSFTTSDSVTIVTEVYDTTYHVDDFGIEEPDFPCGTICGRIFLDDNENGVQDAGELGAVGINVHLIPGGLVQTDVNGDYCADVAHGVATTVEFIPQINGYYCDQPVFGQSFPVSPDNYQITLTSGNPNSNGNDFGIFNAVASHNVSIFSVRTYYGNIAGQDFKAWMDYKNTGGPNPDSCFLTLNYDDEFIDDLGGHSLAPDLTGPGIIVWGFGPGEVPAFSCLGMNFHLDSSANIGDTLLWEAEYTCTTPDQCLDDNTKTREVIVVAKDKNGYDFFNDMQVYLQDEEASTIDTDVDSALSYVINYQNVGNDSAFYIRIVDTLPAELNVLRVSDPFGTIPTAQFYVSDDNVLIWESDQVMIPGSEVDYINSYGFVQFDITVKKDVASGTVIENSASIMFNYSNPVITPITQVLVTNTLGMNTKVESNNMKLFPNPSEGMVNIQLDAGIQNASIELFDITGRSIYRNEDLSSGISTINLSEFDKGIYIYRISDSSTGLVIGSGKLGLD